MADKKISELTSATAVNAADYFPLVQGGTTVKVSIATLLSTAPQSVIDVSTPESPASGALSTTITDSFVTSTTGTTNYTLAAGTQGFKKVIVCQSIAGTNAIVSVTGGTGFSTVTFSAAGQTVELKYTNGHWFVISSRGVVIA